jgi:hypothetical protein
MIGLKGSTAMENKGLLPEKMAEEAMAAIQAGTQMTVVLPRQKRKIPRKFPQGKLLYEDINGWTVYTFDPVKVLAWLAASGSACND